MATVAALSVPRVSPSRALASSRAVPAAIMLVAVAAPFERPLGASIGGFTLTTSELAIVAALAMVAVAWLGNRAVLGWRTPLMMPLIAFVLCALTASMAAPEFRGESLRVAARFAVAVALMVVVANVAGPQRNARQLIAALVGAGAVVGAIAVLELTQLPWILDALTAFRPGFHVVGGQLRATSTLVYPTIASMFLEVAFALGLAWIGASWFAVAALSMIAAGIIATFTRAGLLTMAASLIVYGAILMVRRRAWTTDHTRLVMLAVVIAALVLMSRSPQMLVARMSSEGSQEWYGASYAVPQRITVQPNSFSDIPVTLTNQGQLTWQSTAVPPFLLSYHWLTIDTEEVISYDGMRTPFEQPVEPGQTVTVKARVHAPERAGSYLLVWDVVQEHRTWLSLEGVFPGRSIVVVEGVPSGAPLPTRGRMPGSVMRMPRLVLWRTALTIARAHPLLGIGPDNFRRVYGRELGLQSWDTRVHTNNTYLEVLVGMGLAGLLVLVWLAVVALRALPRTLLQASDARLPIVAAATAACVAIAAHGVVDSFLTFTPTYVVFAIAVGLLFAAPGDVCE